MTQKKQILVSLAVCLVCLLAFSFIFDVWHPIQEVQQLRVGFIYESDTSTPASYNFSLAQSAAEKEFGDRIRVYSRSNVPETEMEEPLLELVQLGCGLIFTNSHSDEVAAFAQGHPSVQFCQVSFQSEADKDWPENYHTFNAAVWQGRYVSGVVAGMKLKELIESGLLDAKDALVGYVAAVETSEVISGYTAFLLGVRSVVPEAVMRVRYTGSWFGYIQEKQSAKELIEEGCVLISHHTNTTGTAIACEEAIGQRRVYHVGYHQSMLDVAPSTSLTSVRINWAPYILGAIQAVMKHAAIERTVKATAWGRDMCAAFDRDWVEITELNRSIVAPGTEQRVQEELSAFLAKKRDLFRGPYVGVDPAHPDDTYDLSAGFQENAHSSYPVFHYVLRDIITVE